MRTSDLLCDAGERVEALAAQQEAALDHFDRPCPALPLADEAGTGLQPGACRGSGRLAARDALKVGDRVIAAKYAGTEVKIDGEECQILRQSDILATVE